MKKHLVPTIIFYVLAASLIILIFGNQVALIFERKMQRERIEQLISYEAEYEYESTIGHGAVSPSGKYRLEIFLDNSNYYFTIVDVKTGKEVYKYWNGKYDFNMMCTTWFMWDGDNLKDDIVWCYSEELGVFCWKNEKGRWKMYLRSEVEYVPKEFRRRRPKIF